MKVMPKLTSKVSFVQKYHTRWVLRIALCWTVIDLLYWVHYMHLPKDAKNDATFHFMSVGSVILRGSIVFGMSCLMGYILIFKLRKVFRNFPLLVNLFIKTGILLLASFVMNFLLHVTYSLFILDLSVYSSMHLFFVESLSIVWLLQHSLGWVLLFILTQITIEVNEKYSPGVFWDILIGRYIKPKVQKRIVMFIDLQDSTPIAEKLGSEENFSFIRDFIYYVSIALLEYNGRIYQYVGDEIVVSWMYTPANIHKCLRALALAIKLLKRNKNYFMKRYGVLPDFKAGIHVGEVTVGEIGIIKKDIAMSGDTMNTTARIRGACNELNHRYLASKEFLNDIEVEWKTEHLGPVDLKGKSDLVELVAINL